jgi:hypothetical protein
MKAVPEQIEVRNLEPGEWVDFSEIGVPGVQLSGSTIKVAIFEDGKLAVCGLSAETIRHISIFAFLSIILGPHPRIGRRELHFLRRTVGMTFEDLGGQISVEPSRIKGMEHGKSSLTETELERVRAVMIRAMDSLMKEIPPIVRELNRASLEYAQDVRTTQHDVDMLDILTAAFKEGGSAPVGEGLLARRNEESSPDSQECHA